MTTTKDGRWALHVSVPRTTQVPLADIEALADGIPVVYVAAPDEPAMAYGKPGSGKR